MKRHCEDPSKSGCHFRTFFGIRKFVDFWLKICVILYPHVTIILNPLFSYPKLYPCMFWFMLPPWNDFFYTLPAEMFGGSDFWLETRPILDTQETLTNFHGDEAKKNVFEKKNQNGQLKKTKRQ